MLSLSLPFIECSFHDSSEILGYLIDIFRNIKKFFITLISCADSRTSTGWQKYFSYLSL